MIVPVVAALPPIETIVWVVLVVIGVLSSIVSNARKAAQSGQREVAVPRRPVAARPAPVVVQAMAQPEPPVVPPAATAVTARRPKVPVADGTPAFRGMFERGNLVRAVIAAEVLGPPKALQEQSIWSPRHSELSI